MGWFDDEVEDMVDDLVEMLVKVLLSGLTLVLSTPTIATATIFNNQIGYVDPLLYPATLTGTDKPLPFETRYVTDAINNDKPQVFSFGILAETGAGKQLFSRHSNVLIGSVYSIIGDNPA